MPFPGAPSGPCRPGKPISPWRSMCADKPRGTKQNKTKMTKINTQIELSVGRKRTKKLTMFVYIYFVDTFIQKCTFSHSLLLLFCILLHYTTLQNKCDHLFKSVFSIPHFLKTTACFKVMGQMLLKTPPISGASTQEKSGNPGGINYTQVVLVAWKWSPKNQLDVCKADLNMSDFRTEVTN